MHVCTYACMSTCAHVLNDDAVGVQEKGRAIPRIDRRKPAPFSGGPKPRGMTDEKGKRGVGRGGDHPTNHMATRVQLCYP